MSIALRLLRIEGRRNLGLWLYPVMAGLAFWVASLELLPRAVLWPSISTQVQYSVLLVGPLTGGLAAWMAGRNRRHGTQHQLETTAYSPVRRDLALFVATVGWGCLAYLTAALIALGIAFPRTTWGMPYWPPLFIGLLGVATNGALGFVAGHYLNSRFVAPLIAVALLWVQLAASSLPGGALHLSPIGGGYTGAFLTFFKAPSAWLLQAFWFLGLIGIALSAVGLKSRFSPLVAGALLVSITVTIVAVAALIRDDPYAGYVRLEPRPYQQVCTKADSGLSVCVHPAFTGTLAENAAVLGELAAPLIGVRGGVERMEQTPGYGGLGQIEADGRLSFTLPLGSTGVEYLAYQVSGTLVGAQGTPQTDAQGAVQVWLLQRIGVDFHAHHIGDDPAREERWIAGSERLAAVDPEARRAWLEENYQALLAGQLTLEDLP